MCGIAGFARQADWTFAELSQTTSAMISQLKHRGPDDEGVWVDPGIGLALGHRRLSILDLSQQGHQPMLSACGRYVIAFNGEIYNFPEVHRELELAKAAPNWRGRSDTEVLLAAISHWGLEASLEKLIGMFAFALWDRQERMLHLARDRMGEKPLYYGFQQGHFLFASELKAIKTHPAWQGKIDRNALTLLLRYNHIPAPHCIYQSIRKLLPGTFVSLRLPSAAGDLQLKETVYWSIPRLIESGIMDSYAGSDADAVEELEQLLSEAVKRQMVADVPVGAFLSGGIDSSTIVALMQQHSHRPVETFTIGFHESGYNEAIMSKAVAQHLGTHHTELYINAGEAIAVIPDLPRIYDEPFSDSSQIPTFLVSQLASGRVTVCMSGDGGDELFGGYSRYVWGPQAWRTANRMPLALRSSLSRGFSAISPERWDQGLALASKVLPTKMRHLNPGDKIHKLSRVMLASDTNEVYRQLVSHWPAPENVVLGGWEPVTAATSLQHRNGIPTAEQRMMYLDLVGYLPDDILVKVDRASMSVSLETRLPLLDHRLVEFSLQLPLSMKINSGEGKRLLRRLLYRYVPQDLVQRPKMGFSLPLDLWLRGPLREWAESLLAENRLSQEGYFDPRPIRQKWQEHLSGKKNWQHHLWDVLMFQSWLEVQ